MMMLCSLCNYSYQNENFSCHGLVAASFDVVVGGVPQLGNGLMPPRAAGMGGNTLAVQTAMNQLDSCGKAYSNLSSPMEPLLFSFDRMIQGRVIKDREVPSAQTGGNLCTESMHVLLIKPFESL